jgi:poly(3-hydroxyalkanoate) depolymerase
MLQHPGRQLRDAGQAVRPARQQFARSQSERCRRLVLCATAPGIFMIPARPAVLLKLASPRRFMSAEYAQRVSGAIYGGAFRRDPRLAAEAFRHIRWQSRLGYYLQLAATAGWTSVPWLCALRQPTLVMAGADDPIAPLPNAHLLRWLIPNAELKVFDCGHLFLLTRPEESARAIEEFLGRPDATPKPEA